MDMISKQHPVILAAALSLAFIGAANAGAVLDKIREQQDHDRRHVGDLATPGFYQRQE